MKSSDLTLRKQPKFFFSSNTAPWLKKVLPTAADFSWQKKIADRALRHKFLVGEDNHIYMFQNVTKGWADFGDNIDWQNLRNTEKTAKLNRLSFLDSLGFMYFFSGDLKYARKSLYLLRDWCKKNPFGADTEKHCIEVIWSSVNAAIRAINLVWLYFFLKDAKQISSDDKLFIIETIYQHGKYLYKVNSDPRYQFGNWQIHELVALAYLGILFPEFKEAKRWKNLAYENLEKQIKRQFFSDGGQVEGSLSYHTVVAQLYLDALLMAKINRIKVSRKLINFTKKMVDFVIAARRPDGSFPLINDSHIVDIDTLILCAEQLFPTLQGADEQLSRFSISLQETAGFSPRSFILRFADRLKEKDLKRNKGSFYPARQESKLFPESGFALMRNRENTHYLFFDASPAWFHHTHAGKLSFDLYSYGKPLIIDAGNCSYDHPDYLNWYKRTLAHNTIQANGRDQVILRGTWQWAVNYNLRKIALYPNVREFLKASKFPKVLIKQWITNENFDFIEAEHHGYLNLANPLIHNRKILYIKGKYWLIIDELKVSAKQAALSNNYKFLLHFSPGRVELNSKEKIANMRMGDSGLLVVPLDKFDIDEVVLTRGRVIHNNESCFSSFLQYRKHNRGSSTFFTLLLPYKVRHPNVKIEYLKRQGGASLNRTLGVIMSIDNNAVYFIYQPYCREFTDLKRRINFQGEILYLESQKKKVNSFIALSAKEITFLDKVLYRNKNAKTIWKKY